MKQSAINQHPETPKESRRDFLRDFSFGTAALAVGLSGVACDNQRTTSRELKLRVRKVNSAEPLLKLSKKRGIEFEALVADIVDTNGDLKKTNAASFAAKGGFTTAIAKLYVDLRQAVERDGKYGPIKIPPADSQEFRELKKVIVSCRDEMNKQSKINSGDKRDLAVNLQRRLIATGQMLNLIEAGATVQQDCSNKLQDTQQAALLYLSNL